MFIDNNNHEPKQFEKFTATHLYCDNCGRSMPVEEVLLLILPDGQLYDYRCQYCHSSVGTRKETKKISFEIEK
ncbi:MAG: cytoplasmic protein [Candidatus Omnitrophica bacterium]|nr:cytoplasmic protein [Candidatus Omnitrophota bacterium]